MNYPLSASKFHEADASGKLEPGAVISVSQLSIRLQRDAGGRERELISNFSFALKKGEIVDLLGRSGAGKTTFLNCVAGFVAPSSGQVTFARHGDPSRPSFAYMFQEDRLLPWRTAVANVELSLERLGPVLIKEIEKREGS